MSLHRAPSLLAEDMDEVGGRVPQDVGDGEGLVAGTHHVADHATGDQDGMVGERRLRRSRCWRCRGRTSHASCRDSWT